jgi:hypothetical protein
MGPKKGNRFRVRAGGSPPLLLGEENVFGFGRRRRRGVEGEGVAQCGAPREGGLLTPARRASRGGFFFSRPPLPPGGTNQRALVYTVTPPPLPRTAQLATYGLTGQTTRANGNLVSPSAAGGKNHAQALPLVAHSLRRRESRRVASLSSRHAGTTQCRGPRKTSRVIALLSGHADTTQYRGPRKTSHVVGPLE